MTSPSAGSAMPGSAPAGAETVAGPQTEAAVTRTLPREHAPAVLDDAQRTLLRAVLNRLVPARTDLPGAGDLDVGTTIEHSLAASARLRRLFLEGLTELSVSCERDNGHDFAELDGPSQTRVLESLEAALPAFFAALVEHAYRGYYTLAVVHAAIGYESRPPQPLGHRLVPFEPSLLDQQRRRPPFWRRTDSSQPGP